MRKPDPLILVSAIIILLILGSLAFIAFSGHRIMLCGKTGACSPAIGQSADFMGFVFLGAGIVIAVQPLKASRYWPLFYAIPGIFVVGALGYLVANAF